MASSIASSSSATICSFHRKPISQNLILSPFSISFPLHKARLRAVKTRSDGGSAVGSSQERGGNLLRKPVAPSPASNDEEDSAAEYSDDDGSDRKRGDGDTWVDWEDQILEDTVPLVGFVRMILHSGKYGFGAIESATWKPTKVGAPKHTTLLQITTTQLDVRSLDGHNAYN